MNDSKFYKQLLYLCFPKNLFTNDQDFLPVFQHLENLFINLQNQDIDKFSKNMLPPHNKKEISLTQEQINQIL